MADGNVRIKLTADSSQIQQELKKVDSEARRLSGGSGSKMSGGRGSSSSRKGDSTTAESEHESLLNKVYTELQQIRKELNKFNTQTKQANSHTAASTTPTTPRHNNGTGGSNTSNGSGGTTPPSNNGGSNKNQNGGSDSDLASKLATVISSLKVLSNAVSYVSQGAQSSTDSKYMAYMAYNTTGMYNSNYRSAVNDAYNMGKPYAFNYDEVLQAGSANLGSAGYTNQTNYRQDMNSILATSRAWGLDTTKVAQSAGQATALGIVSSGSQDQYLELMASSIEKSGMIGREDEQLDALNSIASTLGTLNTSVTTQGFSNALSMYNTLAEQDSGLKGQRGANLVNKLSTIAGSDDSTLNVLAGFGTEYTGLSGRQELRRMAEEDPVQYWQKVYQGAQNYGVSDQYFSELLYQKLGNQQQADEVLKALQNGTLDESNFEEGKSATNEKLNGFEGSDIQTEREKNYSQQNAQQGVGEAYNTVADPFRSWYNGLSSGGRTVADATGGILQGLGTYAVGKVGFSLLQKGLGKLTGAGSAAAGEAAAGAGGAGSLLSKLFGSAGKASEGASAAAEGVAGAAEGAAGAGEALSGLGKAGSVLGKVGKGLGIAGIAIQGISTAVNVGNDLNSGDNRKAAEDAGSGVGGIAGGLGGAAAGAAIGSVVPGIGTAIGGAVGGIIGGLGGGLGGDWLGGKIGGGLYDLFSGDSSTNQASTSSSADNTGRKLSDNTDNIEQHVSNIDDILQGKYPGSSDSGWVADNGSSSDSLNSIDDGTFLPEDPVGSLTTSSSSNSITGSVDTSQYTTDDSSSSSSGGTSLRNTLNGSLGTSGSTKSNGLSSVLGALTGRSHATGNYYVPWDNYLASLHKGEMVLTKSDADSYRQGNANGVGGAVSFASPLELNINLQGDLSGVTGTNQDRIVNAVVQQIQASDLQSLISSGFTRMQNY